ncbi:hypothetical protein [Bacillus sp. OV322]|uniref:hypothetical protein n=1 Tax=Bacillus sp. OV322 TaxID=1882764 RepID=UPI003528EAE2
MGIIVYSLYNRKPDTNGFEWCFLAKHRFCQPLPFAIRNILVFLRNIIMIRIKITFRKHVF